MKEFTSKIEVRVSPEMRQKIDNLSLFLKRRPSSWIRDLLQEELLKWEDVPEALYGEGTLQPPKEAEPSTDA